MIPSPVFDGHVVLDYVGVAAFSVAGALAAASRKTGLLTLAFVALASGLAGGTFRDLLIGAPTFWVSDAGFVAVCVAAGGATFAIGVRAWRFSALLWLDAIGLAVLAVAGAGKAAAFGVPPLGAIVVGFLAAVAGGLVRDMLSGRADSLVRQEMYLSAAVLGAGVFVVLRLFGFPDFWASLAGGAVAFSLRAGAIRFGWIIPGQAAPDSR